MTDPIDAELDSIDMDAKAIANQNPIGTPFAWRKAYLTALARAVLARWGQPSMADAAPTTQPAPQQEAQEWCEGCNPGNCAGCMRVPAKEQPNDR